MTAAVSNLVFAQNQGQRQGKTEGGDAKTKKEARDRRSSVT
jgi:hypothetical protein